MALSDAPRVLVPLCGKSLDLWYLADRGWSVVGVELSPIASRALFAERGVTPDEERIGDLIRYRAGAVEVLCGDIFNVDQGVLGPVQAAYDRAALFALPPETREPYAAHISELLPAGTPLLLVSLTYDQAQMSGPPFSVPLSEVHDLYGGHFSIELLEDLDVLAQSSRFAAQLSTMREQVLLLLRRKGCSPR